MVSNQAPDFIGVKGYGKAYIYTINFRHDDLHQFNEILLPDLVSKDMSGGLIGGLLFTKHIPMEIRRRIIKLRFKKIPYYGNFEKHEYESGKLITIYYYCFASYDGKYLEQIELPHRNCKPAVQVHSSGEINQSALDQARKFILHYKKAVTSVQYD